MGITTMMTTTMTALTTTAATEAMVRLKMIFTSTDAIVRGEKETAARKMVTITTTPNMLSHLKMSHLSNLRVMDVQATKWPQVRFSFR